MSPEEKVIAAKLFLQSGFVEEHLAGIRGHVVDSFGKTEQEIHALIVQYQSARKALLAFQESLESLINAQEG